MKITPEGIAQLKLLAVAEGWRYMERQIPTGITVPMVSSNSWNEFVFYNGRLLWWDLARAIPPLNGRWVDLTTGEVMPEEFSELDGDHL